MRLRYPDEPLPSLQLSLKRFVSVAQRLWDAGDEDVFARYIFAGRLTGEDDQRRVFVNARQESSAPPHGEYELRRDLDSVIGITRNLPFIQAMSVFPMASFEDTLKRDNHMTRLIPDPDASPLTLQVLLRTDPTYSTGPSFAFPYTKFQMWPWARSRVGT
jgi:hypothetical protein